MSTGPRKRANDARETKTEPMEGTALDCPSCLEEAVDVDSVGAWVSGFCLAVQGAGCFPKTTCGHGGRRSCRSAHPTAPGARRVQGGGGGAAHRSVGQRPGPCELARVAGKGSVGVGNERHALRMQKGLTPAASCDSRRGTASGDLGKPLSPACVECRSVHLSLLFRAFAFNRWATSWSPACRGVERVASPDLPRLFRYLAPRRRTFVVEFGRADLGEYPGKLWKIKNLWR